MHAYRMTVCHVPWLVNASQDSWPFCMTVGGLRNKLYPIHFIAPCCCYIFVSFKRFIDDVNSRSILYLVCFYDTICNIIMIAMPVSNSEQKVVYWLLHGHWYPVS